MSRSHLFKWLPAADFHRYFCGKVGVTAEGRAKEMALRGRLN
jgi:hypothetical protein